MMRWETIRILTARCICDCDGRPRVLMQVPRGRLDLQVPLPDNKSAPQRMYLPLGVRHLDPLQNLQAR